MPRDSKPVSLYPLAVEDVLAALVRIPPPPKIVKAAKTKRRASKRPKKRPRT